VAGRRQPTPTRFPSAASSARRSSSPSTAVHVLLAGSLPLLLHASFSRQQTVELFDDSVNKSIEPLDKGLIIGMGRSSE
jgi:hypothetical protein